MMNFDQHLFPAKAIALHYAEKLESPLAQVIIRADRNLASKDEAVELTHFFWEMVDCAVDDQQDDKTIAGETDMEYWMEKLMNVFIGYCKENGYEPQWADESNQINSQ